MSCSTLVKTLELTKHIYKIKITDCGDYWMFDWKGIRKFYHDCLLYAAWNDFLSIFTIDNLPKYIKTLEEFDDNHIRWAKKTKFGFEVETHDELITELKEELKILQASDVDSLTTKIKELQSIIDGQRDMLKVQREYIETLENMVGVEKIEDMSEDIDF